MPERVEQWLRISLTSNSPEKSAAGQNGVSKVAPGVNPTGYLSLIEWTALWICHVDRTTKK